MKKVDFHTHPLDHKYYYNFGARPDLTEFEKKAVREMILLGIERGLDGIAITDHEVFAGAFYARQFVEQENLPIGVIVGAECSVCYGGEEIHILALGVSEMVDVSYFTPVDVIVERIHQAGGIAVLSHPHYYQEDVYWRLKDGVDGMEYYNGVNARLDPSHSYYTLLDRDGYRGLRTSGSDFHFANWGVAFPQKEACCWIDDALFARLSKGRK